MTKTVLFISSTGGHLTELLQLSPLFDKYNSFIMTEKTKNNLSLKEKFDKQLFFMIPGTYTGLINKLKYPFLFCANIIVSFYVFFKIKPDIVVTTGAHNTVPMCYIAHLFRSKVVFIETLAAVEKPTKAGKLVYRIADLFVVQWENMKKFYPKAVYEGFIF